MPTRFTSAIRRSFLDHLAENGNVGEAARLAGTSRAEVYRQAAKSDEFRQDWATALDIALDHLRWEAYRRAVEGVTLPLVHRGAVVRDATGAPVDIRQYSEPLMLYLLKQSIWGMSSRRNILMGDRDRRERQEAESRDRLRGVDRPADSAA